MFGSDRQKILFQWREFVLKSFDEDRHALYTEALFRYPGVLHDRCPHTKADLRRSRKESPFVRLRQPLGWNPKEDYWLWRLDLDDQDRYARLALWRREIKKVAGERALPQGRLETWRGALQKARHWPPKDLEDIEMAILQADLSRILMGRDAGLELLEDLNELMQVKSAGLGLLRQVQARIAVEQVLSGKAAIAWRRYLAGWRKAPPEVIAKDEPWILTYLRLRRGEPHLLDTSILIELLAQPLTHSLAPTFSTEWYKYLGHRLVYLESYAAAEQAYRRAVAVAPPASQAFYQELARFAQFQQNHKVR